MIQGTVNNNKGVEKYIMQQDECVGKKIGVWFPHYCKSEIQRILKEDYKGLYVNYQNQRCSVRPYKNYYGEVICGRYIGIHPKLAKSLDRN